MSDIFWTRCEQEQYTRRMEDEHNRQNRRIGILEENYKQLTELTLSVREQTMMINTMSAELKKQNEKIDKITNVSVDRMQRFKDKAIDTAIGVVVTALVVGLFLLAAQYIQ